MPPFTGGAGAVERFGVEIRKDLLLQLQWQASRSQRRLPDAIDALQWDRHVDRSSVGVRRSENEIAKTEDIAEGVQKTCIVNDIPDRPAVARCIIPKDPDKNPDCEAKKREKSHS